MHHTVPIAVKFHRIHGDRTIALEAVEMDRAPAGAFHRDVHGTTTTTVATGGKTK